MMNNGVKVAIQALYVTVENKSMYVQIAFLISFRKLQLPIININGHGSSI